MQFIRYVAYKATEKTRISQNDSIKLSNIYNMLFSFSNLLMFIK